MFKNNMKIAFRNLVKNKSYSFINIIGLSIGLCCAIFIYMWVNDEITWDHFHHDLDQLHRIEFDFFYDSGTRHVNWCSIPFPPAFTEEIPEITEFTRVNWRNNPLLKYGDKSFYEPGVAVVDTAFLSMFNFPLIIGNKETALQNRNSIILTKETAQKYFGNEDPMGKTIIYDIHHQLTVTGIAENPPLNNRFRFHALIPFEFLHEIGDWNEGWFNFNLQAYVKTVANPDIDAVHKKMNAIVQRHDDKPPAPVSMLFPFKDINLYQYSGASTDPIFLKYVYIFSFIGIFVLLIACINFMNLSTARSSTRAKEIGMKKVIGAQRLGLIKQFLTESVLTAFIALLIAYILISLLLEPYNELAGKQFDISILNDSNVIIGSLIITLLTGLLSGLYPALILSGFKPVSSLKGEFNRGKSGTNFRRILVVFQFALSAFLIIGTTVVYNQIDFLKSKDIGFDKENLISINMRGKARNYTERFKNEVKRASGIADVTLTSRRPVQGGNNTSNIDWEGKDPESQNMTFQASVDVNFYDALNIKIIQGRGFSEEYSGDYFSEEDSVGAFVINKAMADMIGKENPVGMYFRLWRMTGTIVGVADNFNFQRLYDEVGPLVTYIRPDYCRYVLVKTQPGNLDEAVETIEEVWAATVPGFPFEFDFVDEQIGNLYEYDERVGNLAGVFAMIAIFVACMGLFGLVAFAAEKKTKEIGIRQVLGASEQSLITLVSKEFLALILFANIIAAPIAYLYLQSWLQDFQYKIDISFSFFIMAGVLTCMIALGTIFYQAIKAARKNPIDALRYE